LCKKATQFEEVLMNSADQRTALWWCSFDLGVRCSPGM
jgi:hypothetical protein